MVSSFRFVSFSSRRYICARTTTSEHVVLLFWVPYLSHWPVKQNLYCDCSEFIMELFCANNNRIPIPIHNTQENTVTRIAVSYRFEQISLPLL